MLKRTKEVEDDDDGKYERNDEVRRSTYKNIRPFFIVIAIRQR